MNHSKFLGTARTVNELLDILQSYADFELYLEGCNYSSPSVEIFVNEEEKYIELN